jgi:hypothetical protein
MWGTVSILRGLYAQPGTGNQESSLKQFGWVHEIACPSENELYVAEPLNWRVQKLILEPAAAGSKSKCCED